MNVKYFGQFLLENGYINRDQLLEGIRHQKSINLKVGVLAIDRNLMTSSQVDQVVSKQKSENKPFGEIAVELGFLNREQLESLLSVQKIDRIFLGEALVEQGAMTLEQLEQYLAQYKKQQEEADAVLARSFNSINPRFSNVLRDSVQIVQNMLVRLMDQCGKVAGCREREDAAETADSDYLVFQKVFGEKNFIIGFALKKSVLVSMASRVLRREVEEADEYAKDGVKEFLNIVVGHLSAALSNEGIKTETTPPQCMLFESFIPDLTNATQIIVSMLMGEENFELHFFMN
jgi:CheY-specific phosphatase CheX